MDDDARLLKRLRAGDEAGFVALVSAHHDAMVRLATTFVSSRAVAEEVVQDTWLAVVRGIERFEGRSSLRKWRLAILVNSARTTDKREARSIPIGDAGPGVDRARFDATGQWAAPPDHWVEDAEGRPGAGTNSPRRSAPPLAETPPGQRSVVMLRDVDDLRRDEVCELHALSPVNQRVLLHRGHAQLRQALEDTLVGH